MNIGIVTTWHEGGAGYVSRAYMNVLREQGNEVQVYVRGGRYYPELLSNLVFSELIKRRPDPLSSLQFHL